MRAGWEHRHIVLLGTGLGPAALIRLALLPSEGMRGDLDLFAGWTHRLATDVALGKAYDLDLTFGPVMAYMFWLIGQLVPAFQAPVDATDPVVAASLKLAPAVADLAIAAVLVWALRDRPRVAVAAALGVALVPATWYVSSWWGQFEAIYALFGIAAAVLVARGHWVTGGILLGLALGTKPQALPWLVPFAAYALARRGPRGAIVPAVATAGTLAVLWLPFDPAGGPGAYLHTVGSLQGETFAVLSLRAWNPWWILQSAAVGDGLLSDADPLLGPISPRQLGYVAAGIGLLLIFTAVLRRPAPAALYLGLAASVLVGFCLLTTMHERYSTAAIVFLAIILADRRVAVAWGTLAVAVSLNVVAARPPNGEPGSWIPIDGPLGLAGSVGITAVMIVCLALLHRPSASDADDDAVPGSDGTSGEAVAPA